MMMAGLSWSVLVCFGLHVRTGCALVPEDGDWDKHEPALDVSRDLALEPDAEETDERHPGGDRHGPHHHDADGATRTGEGVLPGKTIRFNRRANCLSHVHCPIL